MKVFRSFESAAAADLRALALGFFDGVHRGHRQIIASAIRDDATVSGVLTLEPHPQAVLCPDQAPPLLTGLPHKLRDFAALGVKNAVVLPFDQQTALTTAAGFLRQLGGALPNLRRVAVGPNWRFGHHRAGGVALLRQWCAERGIALTAGEFVRQDGQPVSSSRIRALVADGELAAAAALLGQPYSLFGTVVTGHQLGRRLGFPTVNLATLDQCLPPRGVYFGAVIISDEPAARPAAINIGTRPSLGDAASAVVIEAHLLDFQRDLYGATVSVRPQKFWRPEQTFPSLAALQEQLHRDTAAAQAFHCQRHGF
ncbi:MAG: riboflavin biosynthesis protein RibF [Verrucomicrobiales bacterium]|jgi:riboflavin kinase/FMN adenylyltransferase|nr:riboflavin biosynthesis protein RibF [Verrucomicrobiales bacterium]